MEGIEFVRENTLYEDLLCQLAEEGCEMSQAALKLKRAVEKTNATPVTEEVAREGLAEEVKDVILVLAVLQYVNPDEDLLSDPAVAGKLNRWVSRLKGEA